MIQNSHENRKKIHKMQIYLDSDIATINIFYTTNVQKRGLFFNPKLRAEKSKGRVTHIVQRLKSFCIQNWSNGRLQRRIFGGNRRTKTSCSISVGVILGSHNGWMFPLSLPLRNICSEDFKITSLSVDSSP